MKEFGIKRESEERRDGGCAVIYDPKTKLYAVGKNIGNGIFRLFGGGVNEDEDMQEGVLREVTEESGLHDFSHIEKIDEVLAHYHNDSKNVNRVAQAAGFLIVLKSSDIIETKLEEHEKFYLTWATPEEIIENWKANNEGRNYDHYIYFLKEAVSRIQKLGYKRTGTIGS